MPPPSFENPEYATVPNYYYYFIVFSNFVCIFYEELQKSDLAPINSFVTLELESCPEQS